MDPQQLPLRDLHLPQAIGWWPLAPGWWFLIAVAAAGLAWLLWRAWLRWRRDHARRVALARLQNLLREHRADGDDVRLAKGLSALTRRAMLAYAPRRAVAGLTGERWLRWLDRGLQTPVFSQGAGRALETLPYRGQSAEAAAVDLQGLIDAVRLRLQTPLPPAPAREQG